jgi:transposase
MPRFKPTNREQGIMIPISYEKQITTGTFEHAIDYLVEKKIKMGIFEARYKNDDTGATAYSPKVLLKIVLLAYSRGIMTSREIEKACQENTVFMALSGGQAPDFTTIAHFVSSMKEEIELIFLDILLTCSELDLLGGTEFAIDGCKISSNASKEWSGTFADLKKKKEKLEETIKFLIEKHNEADINDKKPDSDEGKRRKKQIERIEKKAKKIEKFLSKNEPKIKGKRENQSNIIDNESAKMKTSHGVIQGYNGMAIADSKHQIIVKAEAFGSGQEHELLQPMIEGVKENTKTIGLGEEYFKEKKVIGDTGSYCLENLKYLSEEEIDGYIPDQNFRQRDPRFKDRDRFKNKKKALYSKEDFVYKKESDDFVCPEGKILVFKNKRTVKKKYGGRQYNAEEKDCSTCIQRSKCLRKDKTKFRTLYIKGDYFDRNYFEEMKSKIDTAEGRDIYSHRMGIIEPVFGNIRNAKQLNRFTLRTKNKVNIQWMLFCIIHNIEKIFKYADYVNLIEV